MGTPLKAYLVGVGPGAPEQVTAAARQALERADLVLGWELDLRPIAGCLAGKKIFLQDVKNHVRATVQQYERLRDGVRFWRFPVSVTPACRRA